MSNDNLVEELRECATHAGGEGYTCNVMRRAAAEIKQLREVIGLAAEFDAAPDDAEWEPPHPIFQMAQELDALAAELQALKAQMAGQSQVEVMQFLYQHPASGERHTVVITRERVENDMCDALFEELTGCVCQCESVGETNVVECRCDEYAEEFVMVAAPPAAQDVPGLLEALELGLQALNVAVSVYDVQLADRARKGLRQQIAAHRQAQQQDS